MILSEKIEGAEIEVKIQSSNISEARYNTVDKELFITFNNNRKYKYDNVSWETFTKFRLSESQGKFFATEINKKYTYQEIKEDAGTTQN